MCIKKSHSLFSLEQCGMKAGAGSARPSLASHLKFSGDRITIVADTDSKVVPGVWDPPDISGSCPWRREPPMGAWGWGSPSSAATGIHPTSAQSKTAQGIYNFSSWLLSSFFIIWILDVFLTAFTCWVTIHPHAWELLLTESPSRLEQPSFKNKSCQGSGLFFPLFFFSLHITNCFSQCVFALLHGAGVL